MSSKKGQFNINVNPQAKNMMEALGIKPERCEELCGLIEQIHGEHPDYNLGQILQEASMHCESQEEVIFMGYVLGTRVGMEKGVQAGFQAAEMANHVESLFAQLERQHKAHSFSMS